MRKPRWVPLKKGTYPGGLANAGAEALPCAAEKQFEPISAWSAPSTAR